MMRKYLDKIDEESRDVEQIGSPTRTQLPSYFEIQDLEKGSVPVASRLRALSQVASSPLKSGRAMFSASQRRPKRGTYQPELGITVPITQGVHKKAAIKTKTFSSTDPLERLRSALEKQNSPVPTELFLTEEEEKEKKQFMSRNQNEKVQYVPSRWKNEGVPTTTLPVYSSAPLTKIEESSRPRSNYFSRKEKSEYISAPDHLRQLRVIQEPTYLIEPNYENDDVRKTVSLQPFEPLQLGEFPEPIDLTQDLDDLFAQSRTGGKSKVKRNRSRSKGKKKSLRKRSARKASSRVTSSKKASSKKKKSTRKH